MLCSALTQIVGSQNLLRHGAHFSEHACPVLTSLVDWELNRQREGKESSIAHMLAGGNGFPALGYKTHMAMTAAQLGQTIERRDLRALHYWQTSLDNCRSDMHRRFQV